MCSNKAASVEVGSGELMAGAYARDVFTKYGVLQANSLPRAAAPNDRDQLLIKIALDCDHY